MNISAIAIQCLKEALCNIYWYKNDLKSFLMNCISNKSIFLKVNWTDAKRKIASDVVDSLLEDREKNLGDIRRLFNEVSKMNTFNHLEHLEDGASKVLKARNAVLALKEEISKNDASIKKIRQESEKKRMEYEKLVKSNAFLVKLDEIKTNYYQLTSRTDAQQRGFELEKIMYDLFDLFDLDPKASFRNVGEQLDGAFTLEGTDYLFEAKWKKKSIDASDLDAFVGKINRKLDNTLGLFLSINGFSSDAIAIHSRGRSSLILMDGYDLVSVLENQVDLKNLIIRKRRHASQTGNIFYRFKEY
ncbi:restriction endonuclease [Lysinibacillus pakistanensis]|uniref:Restriction endonuclease n=1 Tax=Lysinibacillus pakistanensis TaxID=759811 RepID=A0AAX3WSF3_9BACI|nr:restriction endonuclease [Lysinibacillus pakistanensis]MDM5233842.1 restriction endonuclease [Lysinibacillus pakistanensis]WHY44456.1 restriction endonuclease [Lysinibacillus pakistanensis]WHY49465.1 restriction endonuclease [Lysinibacillus pakistanensis]